jgi:NAD(P)H dehydrogenase (quinone)
MSKVLVLYYSAFGYVAIVANAIAEGARSAGAIADIKRVPDGAASATIEGAHFNSVQPVPVAVIGDLEKYDAIIVGSPTRFGRLSAPMAAFLEQAGDLLVRGVLNGKVGGAFASPTSRNGGHEAASMSIITNLLHFGMIVVGPPYSATTIADATGQRHPSPLDLEGAWQQGKLIAETADRLSGRGDTVAVSRKPKKKQRRDRAAPKKKRR